jgi:hypothetical protein
MDSTFGTRLRLQREGQQIPLATIAEQTKIKLSLLEGLERDDLSRWPTGIFRRSYFRAYARAIGLEPDHSMPEFQELYPDPDDNADVTQALAEARQLQAQPRRPPTRLRCLIDSAVNALPALNLQPGFKFVPSSLKPESVRAAEEPAGPITKRGRPAAQQAVVETTRSVRAARENMAEITPPVPQKVHEESGVDFVALARLCTRLGRASDACDVIRGLEEAVRVMRAVGLVLWVSDAVGCDLAPVFVHGYTSDVTAQLGPVSSDSEAAIARAFRAAEARVVDPGETATGAVVIPLLTSSGCAGVLAIELRRGEERFECVHAAATILAAQLSTIVSAPVLAEAVSA